MTGSGPPSHDGRMTRPSHAMPGVSDRAGGEVPGDPDTLIAEVLDRSAHRSRTGRSPRIQTVHGSRNQLWDTITRLRAQTRREILSLDDTRYLVAQQVPESIQLRGPATLRSALRRGVAVRQVTSRAGLLADRQLRAIVHRAGGQARVVARVPAKLSILDRRVALIPVNTTVLADGFQILRDPEAVATLVALHQSLWRTGAPPEEPAELPPHLAVILAALADGEPDDMTSRRLGLSPRTYSRRIAELTTFFGVHTRFQIALEAARRGWL